MSHHPQHTQKHLCLPTPSRLSANSCVFRVASLDSVKTVMNEADGTVTWRNAVVRQPTTLSASKASPQAGCGASTLLDSQHSEKPRQGNQAQGHEFEVSLSISHMH